MQAHLARRPELRKVFPIETFKYVCIYTHKMFEKLSKKDILAINQQFDKGQVINENSLSFALFQANKTTSWLKACALLVRAVLIDHVFEEGNKRTAAGIIVAFLEERQLKYNQEEIARIITKILTKNITNLIKIEMEVKNVIIR